MQASEIEALKEQLKRAKIEAKLGNKGKTTPTKIKSFIRAAKVKAKLAKLGDARSYSRATPMNPKDLKTAARALRKRVDARIAEIEALLAK